MINKTKFKKAIKELEISIRNSGEIDTANYFSNQLQTIESDEPIIKKLEALKLLLSSGAIVQYANLSYSEEMLLDEVYIEAKKIEIEYKKIAKYI